MPNTPNPTISKNSKGTLYLIPSALGDASTLADVLPQNNHKIVQTIKVFIVEELKTARRFLKRLNKDTNIDELEFLIFNEHSAKTEVARYIAPLLLGKNVGLLSEAGLPCIADPGQEIVREAHLHHINVVPLSGPSSILLALIASGFNGQHFAFVGYLPVEKLPRIKRIKQLETTIANTNQSQIFIETPYRNNQLLQTIIQTCRSQTLLCVAADITLPTQQIITAPIHIWKKTTYDFNKRPAVFILYQ
ncbi:MAG: SAM-dependent methyltransferase [Bacteroidota bacterium]